MVDPLTDVLKHCTLAGMMEKDQTAPCARHGLQLTTPRPKITDITVFAKHLREDSGIDAALHPLFMDAARKRYAWKSGRLDDIHGLESLIDCFGTLIGVSGSCAWVGRSGRVIYCSWAAHDTVAEVFLGRGVADVEKDWAKVTRSTCTDDEAVHFVNRPTSAMRRAVLEVIGDRKTEWG